jgi:hypothetical protein|tara:strand:+ start:346 stop:618 length:273 start_codon:yes stop_codon:yes gene_type:complete
MNKLFDNLPIDLQNEIYKKIIYSQNKNLLKEIESTRYYNCYKEIYKIYGEEKKSIGLSLNKTQLFLKSKNNYLQSEQLGIIINDIIDNNK